MECLKLHERNALKAAALGVPCEWREKIGSDATIKRFLALGWIEPYDEELSPGKKFAITKAGRAALALPDCPGRRSDNRLKGRGMPSRIGKPKNRLL